MQPSPLPLSRFSEEQFQVEESKRAKLYNLNLIKYYIKESYISLLSFIGMIVMFIISVVMTYTNNSTTIQTYSFTHLNPKVLINLGANAGFLVKDGQVYRLFSAIFLHAGIQHFVLNSVSIIGLLMNIQGQYKKIIFALAFFVGGIQGNLMSLFANFLNQNPNVVAVGASTSICAILGLYLATLYIVSLQNGNVELVKKKIAFMVGYLFFISILPGIDFYGHFGSFIAGGLIGLSFSSLKANQGEASLKVKKLKIISLIIYANFSIVLLTIFFI